MYEYIKGLLSEKNPTYVVVDVQGIGFKVFISINAFSKLPFEKKEVFFYISHIVKEDSETLYGFLTKEERNIFELLLTISGIGPKSAMALIGHLTLPSLELAVQSKNIKLIAKTPGIGKKTAERLIIELKDKFEKGLSVPSKNSLNFDLLLDASSALMNLGYQPQVAQNAVKKVLDQNASIKDLSEVITLALKQI